ncbi:MAG: alanine racemase [Bacillota bacterium]|nr:MAG: alanine racemase [Bacillota bacterium]
MEGPGRVRPMRPTWVEVDLDAIAHNVETLQRLAAPAQLMAVVKADGYGHGAVMVARTALAHGARRLAVAVVEEGVHLRQSAIACPILVMGWTPPWQYGLALRYDLELTVSSEEEARALAEAARREGRRVRVHLKVDTGMGRLGLRWDHPRLAEVAARIAGLGGLELVGVFTHLATADDPDAPLTEEQLARFGRIVATLDERGLRPLLRHAANSAALLRLPGARYDLVRPGIALYGLEPFRGAVAAFDLRPALAWKTRVALVKEVPAGTPISYGATFVTRRPSRIAVLPVGYADGLRRALSNRGQVLVGGRRVPIVGRVCMDQVMVDVTDAGPVAVGDEAVLIGRQGDEAITADEMAGWMDTIGYEVVTGIGRRVPRIYLRGGRPVAQAPLSHLL